MPWSDLGYPLVFRANHYRMARWILHCLALHIPATVRGMYWTNQGCLRCHSQTRSTSSHIRGEYGGHEALLFLTRDWRHKSLNRTPLYKLTFVYT